MYFYSVGLELWKSSNFYITMARFLYVYINLYTLRSASFATNSQGG
jgi:hypothetical protein